MQSEKQIEAAARVIDPEAFAILDGGDQWRIINSHYRRVGAIGTAKAVLEAALSTDTEPEGWQLVPKEPTEEMHNAARDWAVKKYGLGIGFDGSDGCYRAMLAAAPASPASKHGDAE